MKKDVAHDYAAPNTMDLIRLVLQNTCHLPPDGDRYQVNTDLLNWNIRHYHLLILPGSFIRNWFIPDLRTSST